MARRVVWTPGRDAPPARHRDPDRFVLVGGLHPLVEADELRTLVAIRTGAEPRSVQFPPQQLGTRVAFVGCESTAHATRTLTELDGFLYRGRWLSARRPRHRDQRSEERRHGRP